jgi:hypothetical protein
VSDTDTDTCRTRTRLIREVSVLHRLLVIIFFKFTLEGNKTKKIQNFASSILQNH